MSRAVRALLLGTGLAIGTLAAASGTAASTVPPTPPPAVTTTVAPVVSVVGAPPSTAAPAVPPAGTRGGATQGSVAKPVRDPWSPRRIATMTALAVVALAAAGYAYGKLRSAPPRHPDLVRRRRDLEGIDPVETG